jgi:hypothetical protein
MVSLKCLIKYSRLPMVATFKLLHFVAFTFLHIYLYIGLRYQYTALYDMQLRHFQHLRYFYVLQRSQ